MSPPGGTQIEESVTPSPPAEWKLLPPGGGREAASGREKGTDMSVGRTVFEIGRQNQNTISELCEVSFKVFNEGKVLF